MRNSDTPPAGVLRFRLDSARKIDADGRPVLRCTLSLDGSWKPDLAAHDGYPMVIDVVVTDSTAFQVRSFCDAIGVTSREFMNATVLDENDRVARIGDVQVADGGVQVMVSTKREGGALRPRGTGWLPATIGKDGNVSGEQ